jgi:hypothetical protein
MIVLKPYFKPFFVILICLFSKISFADFDKGLKEYNNGNYESALNIWEPLAKEGVSNAQYNVGLMYHNGLGTKQDFEQAFKWLLKSSEQGNLNSIRLISTMYALGNGIKKDFIKSYMWAKIGADNDDQNSKILLDGLLKEMSNSEINKANALVQECNNKEFKRC